MSVLKASHCPFRPYEVPRDTWLCSCLGRKLLGEAEMERPWCSQSAIPSPSNTGSTRAWAWFPFRPGAGVQGRGHQGLRKQPSVKTPLRVPSAHSDEGTCNCQRLSGLYRQRCLGDPATGAPLRTKQQGRALFGKRKMGCSMTSCTLGWCYAFHRLLLRSDSGSIPGSLVLGDWNTKQVPEVCCSRPGSKCLHICMRLMSEQCTENNVQITR